ncbi:MAG: TonB-dependent receptor, partial [Rhodospirillaceae bacterium]
NRTLFENNRVNDATNVEDATLRRRDRDQLNKREYHFLDLNTDSTFSTGAVQHQILVGVNGGFERRDFERRRFGAAITPNIGVFNPVLGEGVPSSIQTGTDRITDLWNYGGYIQDIVHFTDQIIFMTGARYDRQSVDFIEQASGFEDAQTTDAFVPMAGIVFQPTEMFSLYGSFGESFNPNSVERRDVNNNSFSPEAGRQFEIGAKTSLFEGRANATIALFDIKKSNITERNTDGDFELLGELKSQGLEIEVQALPLENWQIKFGYAYTDSIVSESPVATVVGNTNAFAPEHDGFIWTRYNLDRQVLGGLLGFSLGLNYEAKRYTNASSTNRVEVPGYMRVDAGVFYETQTYSLALNIENLLDEKYFTGGSSDTRLYPGDPRLITLSMRHSF